MKYTTQANIEAYTGESYPANSLDKYIESAEKFIDNYTSRNFKADTTASARLYSGYDSDSLAIDDCVSISKVEVGRDSYGDEFTEVIATGTQRYYTLPENHMALGVPINKLFLRTLLFICGIQNHRITAKWGYSVTPPADIVQVATVLATNNFKRAKLAGGVSSEKIGDYSIGYASGADESLEMKDAMAILDSYKKYQI